MAPGGLDRFRRPKASPLGLAGRLSTARGPKWCPAHLTVPAATVSGVPWLGVPGPGRMRLEPPGPCNASPMHSHSRPPLPAPHLKMLYRHPFIWGGMNIGIYAIGIKSRAVLVSPRIELTQFGCYV